MNQRFGRSKVRTYAALHRPLAGRSTPRRATRGPNEAQLPLERALMSTEPNNGARRTRTRNMARMQGREDFRTTVSRAFVGCDVLYLNDEHRSISPHGRRPVVENSRRRSDALCHRSRRTRRRPRHHGRGVPTSRRCFRYQYRRESPGVPDARCRQPRHRPSTISRTKVATRPRRRRTRLDFWPGHFR